MGDNILGGWKMKMKAGGTAVAMMHQKYVLSEVQSLYDYCQNTYQYQLNFALF